MKKLIFILLILCNGSIYAQIDSIIYGVNVNLADTTISLGKINPLTGEVSSISSTTYPYSTENLGRTIDPKHKIYYNVDGSILLAFDLISGTLISAKNITQLTNSEFFGINFYNPDSTLYGIALDTTNGDTRLTRIDPNTGIVYSISSLPFSDQMNTMAGNAINPYNSVYYYVSSNHKIVGVDLSTGNILTNPTVVISYGTFGPIVFNCQDSTFYGLAGNMTTGRKFAKIDPQTGIVTYISTSNIAMAIYSDMATLDPFKKLYYFKNSDHKLVGVDIETGDIFSDPTIVPLTGMDFFDFVYNSSCVVNYPLGESNLESQKQTTELFPNPVDDHLQVKFNNLRTGTIEIFSVLGVPVLKQNFALENLIRFDLSQLNHGMYFVKITQKETTETLSFIKR